MFIGAHKRADRYSSWPQVAFQIEQWAEQDLPPKSKSFAAVIEDYIRYRERDHRRGNGKIERGTAGRHEVVFSQ